MTRENLNTLKYKLYDLFSKTNDAYTLINECVRLGMLAERTKNSEKKVTLQDVFDEFNK